MENSLKTSLTLDVSTITACPSFSSSPTPKMKESTSSKYDYFYEITHCHNGFPLDLDDHENKKGVAIDLFCTGVISHPDS